MADIQYLNYGDQQIEQQALLNNLSNNVQKYVQSQPWSNKRKEKFMSAYQDIMSRGLMGASNNTGEWVVNVGGDPYPLNTMSKKDKQMYEEAAYFIQQQMSELPTKASLEEAEKKKAEEEKAELPIFDNNAFITNFRKHISGNDKGGQPFMIDSEWNNLDKRNEKGERGRTERTKKLLEYLSSYKEKFDSSKFNFEEGPFGTGEEFGKRLDAAIAALKSPDLTDDNDALNKLGLNPKEWFNNGTGDPYTGDKEFTELYGPEGSYGQYYNEYLPKKRKEKADAIINKRLGEIKLSQQYGMRISRPLSNLVTRRALADKYGDMTTLTAQLGDYGDKLDNLKPEEMDELLSAFSYGANQSISEDEWNILKSKKEFSGSSINRFKKHPGIDNLIYDTTTKRVIQLYDKNTLQNINYLQGQSSKDLEKTYLESSLPGLTSAESKELGAIALDIASIVDPEPVTASVMGVGAAGLRHAAKNETPGHQWDFWEKVGQGIDYLTGVVGAVPLAGDLVLGGKTVLYGKRVIPLLQKSLRYVMRAGSWKDIWDGGLSEEGRKTASKIINGEELTVQDWRHIGEVIRGVAGHHMLNKSNRGFYKTAQLEGFQTEAASNLSKKLGSNDIWRSTGFASSKIKTDTSSPVLKLTKTNDKGVVETKDLSITPQEKERLDEAFKKVKPSERTAEAKRILGDEKVGDFEVQTEGSWRAKARNWNQVTRKTSDSFGFSRASIDTNPNMDNLNKWLSERGLWSKIKYGTNTNIRSISSAINAKYFPSGVSSTETTTSDTKKTTPAPAPTPTPAPTPMPTSTPLGLEKLPNSNIEGIKYTGELNDNTLNEFKNAFNPPARKTRRMSRVINPKNSSATGKMIDGSEYQIQFGKNSSNKDEMVLIYNGESHRVEGENLGEMKKNLGKMIKDINVKIQNNNPIILKSDDSRWKAFVTSIKDLKRKGYLYQQGGRIDKQKIQIYKKYIGK